MEDQTKNLSSIACSYNQRAFSPLDPTASWLSYLAMAICMFVVVVNFDALAQTSDFRIEKSFCLPLHNAGFEPRVSGAESPED